MQDKGIATKAIPIPYKWETHFYKILLYSHILPKFSYSFSINSKLVK